MAQLGQRHLPDPLPQRQQTTQHPKLWQRPPNRNGLPGSRKPTNRSTAGLCRLAIAARYQWNTRCPFRSIRNRPSFRPRDYLLQCTVISRQCTVSYCTLTPAVLCCTRGSVQQWSVLAGSASLHGGNLRHQTPAFEPICPARKPASVRGRGP